jgi:hypothetical protein
LALHPTADFVIRPGHTKREKGSAVMTGKRHWLRGWQRAVVWLCPFLSGCIPFIPCFYAYPTVSCTRPLLQDDPAADAKVYRVDVVETQRSDGVFREAQHVLTEISVAKDGTVATQIKTGIDHGFSWSCIALTISERTERYVLVKLVRPGYQTITVEPWGPETPAAWIEAATLEEQERALDTLAPQPSDRHTEETLDNASLAPGSASPAHRQALEHLSGEYQRLAAQATEEPEVQCRLVAKAAALRELALK